MGKLCRIAHFVCTKYLYFMNRNVTKETGNETSFVIGEPIDIIGGAVVKTVDGDVEVKNTIEARMLRYRKHLRSEVAKKLFR